MLYRFKDPMDDMEAQERFYLVENRGERLLVADASPCWNGMIRPQVVYLASDLEVCE